MIQVRSILPAALLLAAIGSARAGAAEAEPGQLVQARLLTNHATFKPGSSFLVGVHFKIRPKWHLYWRDPGASGLPTEVVFQAPTGVTVGPLRWPVPEKFDQGEGLVGYGYQTELLLAAEVHVADDYRADRPLRIEAHTRWLACRESCVAGEKKLRLTLAPGPSKPGADSALFDQWQKRLPLPVRGPSSPARSVHALPGKAQGQQRIALEWKQTPQGVDCYPAGGTAAGISDITIENRRTTSTLTYTATIYSAQDLPADGRIPAVIVYRDAEGVRRGLQLALPVAPPRPAPSGGARVPGL